MIIPGTQAEYKLDAVNKPNAKLVLFMPGMSGGALSEKYDGLGKLLNDADLDLLRIQSWNSPADLDNRNLSSFAEEISKSIDFAFKKGYRHISAIGKSFGGTMLLCGYDPRIEKLVLWAPVVGINEKIGTVDNFWLTAFSEIKKLQDVSLNTEKGASIQAQTLILHGTEDQVIPIENSRRLANILPNASVQSVPEMGHSPKSDKECSELYKTSVQFLTKEKDALDFSAS